MIYIRLVYQILPICYLFNCFGPGLASTGWYNEKIQVIESTEQTGREHAYIDSKSYINVTVSNDESCQLDRLVLNWRSGKHCNIPDYALALFRQDQSEGVMIDLTQTHINSPTTLDSTLAGIITCDINENHCIPLVSSISAQSERNRLVLVFNTNTNQLDLNNATAIHNALRFTPSLQYDGMYGEWVTPNTLELQLNTDDIQSILQAHSSGKVIEVTPFTAPPTETTGSVTIRPKEIGLYHVIVVDKTNNMQQLSPELASAPVVNVVLCDDSPVITVPRDLTIQTSKQQKIGITTSTTTAAAKKTLEITGPVAITGQDSLTFAHTTIDPKDTGTFSVSAWIRLVSPPTGTHRAFLYKGSSDGSTRTPSIWLMPRDNRLSVRVSTASNPDSGAETISALPQNEWTYITLVFTNHTSSSISSSTVSSPEKAIRAAEDLHRESGFSITHPTDYYSKPDLPTPAAGGTTTTPKTGSHYTVQVYFNGNLDVKMDFSDPVLSNNFSANFFKDISFAGPQGFVSQFSLWDGPLTAAEVEALYLSNTGAGERAATDSIVSLLSAATNRLMHASAGSTTGTVSPEDPLVPILLQRAQASLDACESYEVRLDLYADAAERGSAEALYKWALLVRQGSEIPNSACGVATAEDTDTSLSGNVLKRAKTTLWGTATATTASTTEEVYGSTMDAERSVLAFLIAADMGHAPALVSLSFVLMNGVGAQSLLNLDVLPQSARNIPMPAQYAASLITEGALVIPLQIAIRNYLMKCRLDRLAIHTKVTSLIPTDSSGGRLDEPLLGQSVVRLSDQSSNRTTNSGASHSPRPGCPDPAQLSVGVLQVAAMHRVAEAHQALAYRYKEGLSVRADTETAVFYMRLPSHSASVEFQRIGAQAVIETDRIDDRTAPQISKGHEGNDDELIQHQKVRAKEGHIPSILAMADLYYYGARGLPRDHPRALRYYEQAAELGNQDGLCGAAGMYLKGEGAPANVTRAVNMYENATTMGSIRALNGLGYMYFYGQSVPQNYTKALDYFLAAAAYETDGDSLFNAAHCLEHGIGGAVDVPRAVQLYSVAANKLGSFNSIHTLAGMYIEGRGVKRSAATALQYYSAATAIGPWAGWMRRGFDQYLRGHYDRSVGAYLHAAELGYEVAQSNAAYILRSKLKPSVAVTDSMLPSTNIAPTCETHDCTTDPLTSTTAVTAVLVPADWGSPNQWRDRLLYRLYQLSAHHGNKESLLHAGSCYFKASCGIHQVDYTRALWYYSKASAAGHPLASTYIGVMHHFGLGVSSNLLRAQRYYDLAITQEVDPSVSTIIHSLKYALGLQDYYFMMPINMGVDYVVRKLWKM